MSYRDLSVHSMADSGQIGLIPEDIYLRKIETTPTTYEEDSAQVEQYFRNTLRDISPDKSFAASGEIRSPSDRNGGFHSTERLALRHSGKRTEDDPFLPEGTFLEFSACETDNRGICNQPDFRQFVEQQYARASLIKFYNDEDFSTTEQGINPVKMVENKTSMFYPVKDRMQIFEESQDSWHNGSSLEARRSGGSDSNKTSLTSDIIDLTDSTVRNRQDATSMLSNDPTIAYRYVTPDHRVKTAKYGMVRANQDQSDQQWDQNRKSTFLDHANMAMIDGQRVNKMLGDLIHDLENRRKYKQLVTQGAAYGDSSTNQISRRKLEAADIYKALRIGGQTTTAESANQEFFEGKSVRKYGNKPMNDNRTTIQHAQINHHIIQSMEQATKRQKDQESFNDLRESIEESAKHRGVFQTAKNKRLNHESKTSNQTRNAQDLRQIEDSKKTMNYAGLKPMDQRNPQDKLKYEKYGAHSLQTQVRKGHRDGFYGINNVYDFAEYDTDMNKFDFGLYNKAYKEEARDHMGRNHQEVLTDGEFENQLSEVQMRMFNPA